MRRTSIVTDEDEQTMIDTLFTPVTCTACNRTSALALSVSELKDRIANDGDIELHCAYDDFTWNASPKERLRISRLLEESDAVWQRSWFRLGMGQLRPLVL
jgi:hypothetical protein